MGFFAGFIYDDFISHLKLLVSNAAFGNTDLGARLHNYDPGG